MTVFSSTVFGEQHGQMNAMDFVVDADEGQCAALLFDAGQVNTEPEKGIVFTPRREL